MAVRLTGDRVEVITQQEVEALWRAFLEAADALNNVRDDMEKVAAGMQVFGRRWHEAEEAVRRTPPGIKPRL